MMSILSPIWNTFSSAFNGLPRPVKSACVVLVLVVALIVTLRLVFAPPCVKIGALDFVNDGNENCVRPKSDKDVAPKPDASSATSVASPSATPSPSASPDAKSDREPLEVFFAPKAEAIVRSQHGLERIGAEDKMDDMPPKTFGFVYVGTFASYWRTNPAAVPVRTTPRGQYFELHRRPNGKSYILGFLRRDVANCLQNGGDCPKITKISPTRFGLGDVLAVVPIDSIKSVEQSEITVSKGGFIPVLELELK